jgi:hypothetical protein
VAIVLKSINCGRFGLSVPGLFGGITLTFPTLPIIKQNITAVRIPVGGDAFTYKADKPYFYMLTDNGIAALFLETVAANPEDAWAFVSRHYSGSLDMEALRNLLGPEANRLCACLINATYVSESKNRRTRSVLVMDREGHAKQLLHLHMIKEPDRYGQWKIYGVDQE